VQRVRRHQLFKLRPLMAQQIRIGTRGSQLALWQSNWVKSTLMEKFPGLAVELVIIKTKGDKIQDVPLARVGGKGLFVKEIEEAILDRRVDLAVHSMKDMPAQIPRGLCIGAIPDRENPKDALVSRNGLSLTDLPQGARIGTSSLRRAAQLKHLRPDLEILPLRGNLDTRLKKLETEGLDAVVLAAAGLRRMDLAHRVTQYLDETEMLPAVGQGALCIESRESDPDIGALTAALDHARTRTVVLGERAFLHRLEGGCQVPIAAHGTLDGGQFSLIGMVASLDGAQLIRDTLTGPADQSESIGIELAERLLARGAGKLLETLKDNYE
jgi:hydroxymethylbilane synthase